jgi:hypothetical protein
LAIEVGARAKYEGKSRSGSPGTGKVSEQKGAGQYGNSAKRVKTALPKTNSLRAVSHLPNLLTLFRRGLESRLLVGESQDESPKRNLKGP